MRGNQQLKRRFQVHKLLVRFSSWRINNSLRHGHVQVWLIALTYTSLLLMLFFGPVLKVKKVECVTNHPPGCPDFILPELSKSTGQIIYTLQKKDVADKIHKNTPLAEYVEIVPKWPHTIVANIVWQEPIAQVAIPASNSAYLVAETGHIIGGNDILDPSLPTIVAESAVDLIINDRITDSSLTTALSVINLLSNSKYSVRSIYIKAPLYMLATISSGHQVLLTATKSASDQVRGLQLILSQSTINPATQLIDLRPARPVIKPIQQATDSW